MADDVVEPNMSQTFEEPVNEEPTADEEAVGGGEVEGESAVEAESPAGGEDDEGAGDAGPDGMPPEDVGDEIQAEILEGAGVAAGGEEETQAIDTMKRTVDFQPEQQVEQMEDEPEPEAVVEEESIMPDLEPTDSLDQQLDALQSLMEVDSKGSMERETKAKLGEKKKLKVLGSIISIRRGNQEMLDRAKIPKFMNSYKLESERPFNIEKVESIIKEVLDEALEHLTYEHDKVAKQAKWASSAIRAKIKEQDYERYKIVCLVSIGEKRSQDVFTLFRVLWDIERDKYALCVHENMHCYAIGLCFGLYYE